MGHVCFWCELVYIGVLLDIFINCSLYLQVLFDIMGGTNWRERPCGRWTDDVMEWCNSDVWRLVVQCVVDTHGH